MPAEYAAARIRGPSGCHHRRHPRIGGLRCSSRRHRTAVIERACSCSWGNRMRCTTRNLPHHPIRRSDTRHGRPLGGHFIPTDGYLVSQTKVFQRIPAASMHLLVKITNFLWAHSHCF